MTNGQRIKCNRLIGAPDCFKAYNPFNHWQSKKRPVKFECAYMKSNNKKCRKCREIEKKYQKKAETY